MIRLARWKIDLGIASQYLSPFFAFQTLATIIYSTFSFVNDLFSGYMILVYYGGACITFLFIFKIFAKVILWLKLYDAERSYERRINPFDVDRVNLLQCNYSIPFSIASCDLGIANAEAHLMIGDKLYGDNEKWLLMRSKVLHDIDCLKIAQNKYDSLRFNDNGS